MENSTYNNNLDSNSQTEPNQETLVSPVNSNINVYETGLNSDEKETTPVSSNDDLNWNDSADVLSQAAVTDNTNPSVVQLAIDWTELEGALENNSPDLHSFLNKETGDVIRIFNNGSSIERRLQDVEADPAYLYVEPISSREQYKWMEEFIEEIEDCPLKDKLMIAVDGKGAFRRFKDVLAEDQEKRELWFAKRSKKLHIHINSWLKTKNIEASNPAPGEEGFVERKFETIKKNRYASSYTKTLGTSLRRMAHELIDLVPSRDLSTAVAFLEFLAKEYKPRDDND